MTVWKIVFLFFKGNSIKWHSCVCSFSCLHGCWFEARKCGLIIWVNWPLNFNNNPAPLTHSKITTVHVSLRQHNSLIVTSPEKREREGKNRNYFLNKIETEKVHHLPVKSASSSVTSESPEALEMFSSPTSEALRGLKHPHGRQRRSPNKPEAFKHTTLRAFHRMEEKSYRRREHCQGVCRKKNQSQRLKHTPLL